MFFQPIKRIAFVNKDSLLICCLEKEKFAVFPITPDMLKYQEVVGRNSLVKNLQKFLGDLPIKKQKIVVMLGFDLVFSTSFPRVDAKQDKLAAINFLANVPLETTNMARKILLTKKDVHLFVANQVLIDALLEAFSGSGWRIARIVPASIFLKAGNGSVLTKEVVRKILSDQDRLRSGDLLKKQAETPFTTTNPEEVTPQSSLA